MQSSFRFGRRAAPWLVVLAGLAAGCASSAPAPAEAPVAVARQDVLDVEGQLVEVGGRQVAYLEAIPPPNVPLLGAPVQLRVGTVPSGPITAVVTHVEPRLDGWLELEADVVQRDARVATATPFAGQIILRGR